jgi:hypothetical protein
MPQLSHFAFLSLSVWLLHSSPSQEKSIKDTERARRIKSTAHTFFITLTALLAQEFSFYKNLLTGASLFILLLFKNKA